MPECGLNSLVATCSCVLDPGSGRLPRSTAAEGQSARRARRVCSIGAASAEKNRKTAVADGSPKVNGAGTGREFSRQQSNQVPRPLDVVERRAEASGVCGAFKERSTRTRGRPIHATTTEFRPGWRRPAPLLGVEHLNAPEVGPTFDDSQEPRLELLVRKPSPGAEARQNLWSASARRVGRSVTSALRLRTPEATFPMLGRRLIALGLPPRGPARWQYEQGSTLYLAAHRPPTPGPTRSVPRPYVPPSNGRTGADPR